MKDQTIEAALQEIIEAAERIRNLAPRDEDVLTNLHDILISVISLSAKLAGQQEAK